MKEEVTINAEQRLYVIPSGNGYSCLGFDVCKRWTEKALKWLLQAVEKHEPGTMPEVFQQLQPWGPNQFPELETMELYHFYKKIVKLVCELCSRHKIRADYELNPKLKGLEGRRVECVMYGEKRRFYVGRSMGPVMIHLEIKRRDSSGGCGISDVAEDIQNVRVLPLTYR